MEQLVWLALASLVASIIACGGAPRTVSGRGSAQATKGASVGHPNSNSNSGFVETQPATAALPQPQSTREPYNAIGRNGVPAGRTDENGTFYGRDGLPTGRVDTNGQYYDGRGLPAGRGSSDGTLYDASGLPRGRINDDGQIFGRAGVVIGRIGPDGTIYDRESLPAGRIEPACNADCRRDVARRYLDNVDP